MSIMFVQNSTFVLCDKIRVPLCRGYLFFVCDVFFFVINWHAYIISAHLKYSDYVFQSDVF